jgi:hypothetical protein
LSEFSHKHLCFTYDDVAEVIRKGVQMMQRSYLSISAKTIALAVSFLSGSSIVCLATTIPASTAIPVRFTQTVDSAKAKSGDTVTAQTIQSVVLPDGTSLSRGALLIGHVVDAHPYVFDSAQYAKQAPSVLAIHFDRAVDKGSTIPLSVAVRALADKVASDKASSPTYGIDDNVGTMIQVGGDQYTPGSRVAFSPGRDAVAYVRQDGVHARLIANEYVHNGAVLHCDGTSTEQSIGIFSANACGFFGYNSIYMESNGSTNDGIVKLESHHDTVKIYAGSTALLETL